MTLTVGKTMEILLVEDNPADALLARETMGTSTVPVNLTVVKDGVEAMDYLNRQNQFVEVQSPDLVLLDLNLPRKDGRRVLEEIRSQARLRRIPVVVLTSSEAESDVNTCYDLGANCYVKKPTDFQRFQTVMRGIEKFWYRFVVLPDDTEPGARGGNHV